jgi:16S rRNA processing protein RimM
VVAEDYVVVGRIGRAHGIKGELSVEPRTDEPERRFTVGAVLDTRRGGQQGTLTITTVRTHQGRLLVRFAEIANRNEAEMARGIELTCPVDPDETPEDSEEFYDHQLVGLRVEDPDGAVLGTVTAIEHNGAQDLLHLDIDGRDVLFPFVTALVPEVDVPGGRLVVDDRPGLLAPEPE